MKFKDSPHSLLLAAAIVASGTMVIAGCQSKAIPMKKER